MRKITKYEALWFTLGGPVAFWILALFIDAEILRSVFRYSALGVCLMIAAVWFMPMVEEVRHHGKESEAGGWVIVLGVFYWSFTLGWQQLYAIIAVAMGRPPWLIDGPLAAFVPFSIMWGGILFLLAPGMKHSSLAPNRKGLLYLLLAAFIGGVAAGYASSLAVPVPI
jgi:hypothetical protein